MFFISKEQTKGTNEMTPQNKLIADMISIYFAGVAKTQEELRSAISALAATKLFKDVSAEDVEAIARHNEATQGINFF
ncbi:hypothetical protein RCTHUNDERBIRD_41 [Rhodobacter phage RcThunderbird]|nr:hypothetical protein RCTHUNDERBIRD_41 [Rhodobacter phage RcThunderbird]